MIQALMGQEGAAVQARHHFLASKHKKVMSKAHSFRILTYSEIDRIN